MAAPLGNQNAAKGKRWTAAIERALERRANGKEAPQDCSDFIRGVDSAADKFVAEVFEGKDLGYFKELGDRLEGKPVIHAEQKHEHRMAETIGEEHARLVAEGFLESLRSSQGDSAKEPDRLHDNIQT